MTDDEVVIEQLMHGVLYHCELRGEMPLDGLSELERHINAYFQEKDNED